MTKDKLKCVNLNPLLLFICDEPKMFGLHYFAFGWMVGGVTHRLGFTRFCDNAYIVTRRTLFIDRHSQIWSKTYCKQSNVVPGTGYFCLWCPLQSDECLKVLVGADATHKLLKTKSKLETCGMKQQTVLEQLLCQLYNRSAAGVSLYSATKQTHIIF